MVASGASWGMLKPTPKYVPSRTVPRMPLSAIQRRETCGDMRDLLRDQSGTAGNRREPPRLRALALPPRRWGSQRLPDGGHSLLRDVAYRLRSQMIELGEQPIVAGSIDGPEPGHEQ